MNKMEKLKIQFYFCKMLIATFCSREYLKQSLIKKKNKFSRL